MLLCNCVKTFNTFCIWARGAFSEIVSAEILAIIRHGLVFLLLSHIVLTVKKVISIRCQTKSEFSSSTCCYKNNKFGYLKIGWEVGKNPDCHGVTSTKFSRC
ncbi:hypothetical protein GOODEAATRI_030694 [Goodea atripinnis]|uniref:Uncharacterized protein n=1 Tax=Goodea atripinnis TaxID=208336 RepID=A0ABV0MM45_9TELE